MGGALAAVAWLGGGVGGWVDTGRSRGEPGRQQPCVAAWPTHSPLLPVVWGLLAAWDAGTKGMAAAARRAGRAGAAFGQLGGRCAGADRGDEGPCMDRGR